LTTREWGSVMTDVTAEMGNKTAQADQTPKFSDQTPAQNGLLDGRYQQIGISAVAAAARIKVWRKTQPMLPRPADGRIIPAKRPPEP
ncbi:MAG: hypothetical protein WAM99_01900, partial [Xanthobacteraceae bacterium]